MKVGYARCSSVDQNLDVQLETLKKVGWEKIYKEKVSGTSTQGRDELKECLDYVREGDELVITRIDRLARSVLDLQLIVKELSDKGVNLTATEQSINTQTVEGKCFLDMLGVFAEFETNLRKERQLEGIAKAKVKGVYKGRKSTIDADMIRELKESGLGASAIAKQMSIHRDSVYRVLKSKEIEIS